MAPNLGIVIFEVTVTGRVDCIPPTPTPSSSTPSPTTTAPPQPTDGFWIVDQTDSFAGLDENYIVPDSADTCTKIANPNIAFPYQVTVEDGQGNIQDPPKNFVLTADEFSLSQEFVNMCNIKGLIITMTRDGTDTSRLSKLLLSASPSLFILSFVCPLLIVGFWDNSDKDFYRFPRQSKPAQHRILCRRLVFSNIILRAIFWYIRYTDVA
jgi:hypothetical protein